MNNNKRDLASIKRELISNRSINYERVAARMGIAAQIYDTLKAQGMTQKELARRLNVQESCVTKWLSGSHNFTVETLLEIESTLNIKIELSSARCEEYSLEKVSYEDYSTAFFASVNGYRRNRITKRESSSWSVFTSSPSLAIGFC